MMLNRKHEMFLNFYHLLPLRYFNNLNRKHEMFLNEYGEKFTKEEADLTVNMKCF